MCSPSATIRRLTLETHREWKHCVQHQIMKHCENCDYSVKTMIRMREFEAVRDYGRYSNDFLSPKKTSFTCASLTTKIWNLFLMRLPASMASQWHQFVNRFDTSCHQSAFGLSACVCLCCCAPLSFPFSHVFHHRCLHDSSHKMPYKCIYSVLSPLTLSFSLLLLLFFHTLSRIASESPMS